MLERGLFEPASATTVSLIVLFATILMSSSTTVTSCTCSCRRPVDGDDYRRIDETVNGTAGICAKTLTSRERKDTRGEQRVLTSYRPHGNLARLLLDKQRADERLENYDKTRWYTVDKAKIRQDIAKLWVPLGSGARNDQPDKVAENFITRSAERSDSLPLQAWHSLARSALSWFVSQTSINGLLGRGSMHVFSAEQFQKIMDASRFTGPWHSVVDLGAGDGATTAHIAHLFDRVYATDVSTPMQWALSKRKFTVLDIDKWHEAGPFNVVLCLNLLDRCDRPDTLLRQLRTTLAPGGRLVVALVLPFSPYVEVGQRGDHKPSEYLPIKGNGLEGQIASLVDRVFAPVGLECLAWSKLPYLCEGDLGQSYYFLDDVIFVLENQQKEPYSTTTTSDKDQAKQPSPRSSDI